MTDDQLIDELCSAWFDYGHLGEGSRGQYKKLAEEMKAALVKRLTQEHRLIPVRGVELVTN